MDMSTQNLAVDDGEEPVGAEEDLADWEAAEGIPRAEDPFIQKYFQGRDALFTQEDKHRSDKDFAELLSPMAVEACSIVGQIRFEEQQTVWTAQVEDDIARNAEAEVFPGMMFSLARERMEKTKLWEIVRRMPKGALLHCHVDAMVDRDWLIRVALETDGIYFGAEAALTTPQARENTFIFFQYKNSAAEKTGSVFSDSYTPNTLVPINEVAEAFPDGGKEGFITWLVGRLSITAEESLNHHHGPNSIWRKFTTTFRIIETLLWYEPILRQYLARMFQDLLEDGVRWVDMRCGLPLYRKQGNETPETDREIVVGVFQEEIDKFKASEQGKGFWGARLIWTALRIWDNRLIAESMKGCIAAKIAHPDTIAGFDLVGQEDAGRSLADLTPLLFWFKKRCAEAGVNIPFFFHAGETLGTGTEADVNLFDAILLGTRRIGHGFSLYKHPLLMNMTRDRRILVESCPISNEVLRLCGSIASHPLPALLAHGVPVALCNDDPAVLGHGAAGMSHDFWQALQGLDSLGLEGLGALAENSVRWAAFEDSDNKTWTEEIKQGAFGHGVKAKRMKEWKREWEKFCQWVVLEYGVDADLDPEE